MVPLGRTLDIDISGIDKAKLLAALHNGTRPLGLGVLHARGDMSEEDASEYIAQRPDGGGSVMWFDYVHGRPIKVGFDGNTMLRADLYDRDAPGGRGSAERIVASLRK
jgi:hypothetical protein